MPPIHSNEVEHRLTLVERDTQALQAGMDRQDARLTDIERKQITARDWIMIAGSLLAILGAWIGKFEWDAVLTLLGKR